MRVAVKVAWSDEELVLNWKAGKVSLEISSDVSEAEWSYLQSRGLYGKYGHRLDLEDCRLVDLTIAIGTLVGVPNVLLDEEASEQIQREVIEEEKNPIPVGAQS